MSHQLPTHTRLSDTRPVALRAAQPADSVALARLAALDSSRPPRGTVLLAEVDGELWAALGVEDRHAIADPFRPSRGALALLRSRAEHLSGEPRPRRLAALRPRLAA